MSMNPVVRPAFLLLGVLLLSSGDGLLHGDLAAQSPPDATGWSDTAPHQVRFISVAPEVRLEVLDFGGSARPVVFLSGLGDTGHSFDDFAPKLTDLGHIYAVTRRGYGASSHPASGYGIARLAEDVRAVLDSLHLENVVLVGHSLGGDELTKVASTWPERVSRLVYLDAAHDRVGLLDRLIGPDWPEDPPMTAADSASPEAVRAYLATIYGFSLNDAELHQWYEYDATGRMIRQRTPDSVGMRLILPQVEHPAYARITARVLAIYNVPTSPEVLFPRFRQADSLYRVRATRAFARSVAWADEERARLRRELPGARIVELRDSNHYVFIVSEADVLREMRTFLKER
jgi:pimeloyl-ACP methyl ester carboxylesterase